MSERLSVFSVFLNFFWFHIPNQFCAEDLIRGLAAIEKEAGGAPISDSLDVAVAIVQLLADQLDEKERPAAAIFVPNERGVMTAANTLLCNDAPWLPDTKDPSELLHPKISAIVGFKLGVLSLRQHLILQNADMLGIEGAEAYGQSESLTSRLR